MLEFKIRISDIIDLNDNIDDWKMEIIKGYDNFWRFCVFSRF